MVGGRTVNQSIERDAKTDKLRTRTQTPEQKPPSNFYLHLSAKILNPSPEKVASIAYWLDSSPSQPQLVRIIRLFFGPSISKHQL